MFSGAYLGTRVLVTGHTGFKGSWLCHWLIRLGAEVTGLALPPGTDPQLFSALGLERRLDHHLADIRDPAAVLRVLQTAKPAIVFHLAAQALVRRSYAEPKATFDINIGGTVNVLEAVRATPSVRSCVVVTSDKVYENREWEWGYRECDALGGHDPYSASKAAAEIVTASWRRSFLADGRIRLATARAGNVIGGGDWSADRLVPDFVAALSAGRALELRNPQATRPWQHVLDPLSGYLHLAASLVRANGASFAEAWNFGPDERSVTTVAELAGLLIAAWGSGTVRAAAAAGQPHEAGLLKLDVSRAAVRLGWRSSWDAATAVAHTAAWYRAHRDGGDCQALSDRQIAHFSRSAAATGQRWADDAPSPGDATMMPDPDTAIYQTTTACRSCMRPGLQSILDLGVTPLANALLPPGEQGAEPRVPLHLVFCPSCSLLQIDTTVRPDVLFRNYLYRSSFSDAFLRHAEVLCARVIAERRLGPGTLVVEVASNDGYLLKNYKRAGIPVLGIEPATNIARIAVEEHGIPTVNEFFGSELAIRLRGEGRRAQVIHANNVLAHVADLNGFIKGFRTLLADDGVVISESPYALDFIDKSEFDTIYHEHLCYYSLTALDHLFRRHGLAITDAERIAVHGGSLRIIAAPIRPGLVPKPSVAALLAEEAAWGVAGGAAYSAFAGRVARIRLDLVALLDELHANGKRIAAYGAAAKGATLLNYAGLRPGIIDFVADRSPLKHGKLMPGVRLPILPAEEIARRQPDYLLILAWNFADEIIKQQAAYRRAGGAFIVPIPDVRIV